SRELWQCEHRRLEDIVRNAQWERPALDEHGRLLDTRELSLRRELQGPAGAGRDPPDRLASRRATIPSAPPFKDRSCEAGKEPALTMLPGADDVRRAISRITN